MNEQQVHHNEAQTRFEIEADGELAKASYRRQEDSVLVFDHTFVPLALRGRGLAGRVVKAGLEFARENGLKVVPQCSYVARYIERHPDYHSLVAAT